MQSELLSEVGHHVAQLCSADEAVAIAIEDLEGLNQFLFGVSVLTLQGVLTFNMFNV